MTTIVVILKCYILIRLIPFIKLLNIFLSLSGESNIIGTIYKVLMISFLNFFLSFPSTTLPYTQWSKYAKLFVVSEQVRPFYASMYFQMLLSLFRSLQCFFAWLGLNCTLRLSLITIFSRRTSLGYRDKIDTHFQQQPLLNY